MGALLAELAAFALAVGFSPLHIALLLLLLLGPQPLRRAGWFVAGWLLTTAAAVGLLLSVGHGLVLTMEKGSGHRTGLDLLAAGALLGLGVKELLSREEEGQAPGWTNKLEQFCAMPLPLLLGVSAGLELASPDDVFLLAKTAGSLLQAGLGLGGELLATAVFTLVSGLLLLLPLLALVALGAERGQPLVRGGKEWLFARGDLLVGLVSIGLALYLGWQGVDGLRLGLGA
ncbi:MAG: GAP family protein [Cyanobium sp.]